MAVFLCVEMLLAQVPFLTGIHAAAYREDTFIRGVDVSTLDMLEKLGAKYYSQGRQDDALKILHDNGANYVRLKL